MLFLSSVICPKAQGKNKESEVNKLEYPGATYTDFCLFIVKFIHYGLKGKQVFIIYNLFIFEAV